MDLKLTGKLVVVSGSTAGTGYSIAESLAREGTCVIMNGRTKDSVQAAIERLSAEFKCLLIRIKPRSEYRCNCQCCFRRVSGSQCDLVEGFGEQPGRVGTAPNRQAEVPAYASEDGTSAALAAAASSVAEAEAHPKAKVLAAGTSHRSSVKVILIGVVYE